jgi:hypothetical protein
LNGVTVLAVGDKQIQLKKVLNSEQVIITLVGYLPRFQVVYKSLSEGFFAKKCGQHPDNGGTFFVSNLAGNLSDFIRMVNDNVDRVT